MVIDEQMATRIKEVFKQYYDFKDEAKVLSGSANDLMKGLAQNIAGEEDYRVTLKALNKSYREWKEALEGVEDSLEPTLTILEALK